MHQLPRHIEVNGVRLAYEKFPPPAAGTGRGTRQIDAERYRRLEQELGAPSEQHEH